MSRLRTLVLLVLLVVYAPALGAQVVQGVVRDSVRGAPVPGAVISLFDASHVVRGRLLSNESGSFSFIRNADVVHLRVQRLGYRPRELRLPSSVDRVDVTLAPVPSMLDSVRVVADKRCPSRADRSVAQALLQQVRAGLLTVVVARQARPGSFVRLYYEKLLADDHHTVKSMTVNMDSTVSAVSSFASARSGSDLAERGFRVDSAGQFVFLGPDADVLLDDGFAAAYCFRIADPQRDRTRQIGLSFSPASRKRDRIDVEGTLWIDTVARALRDIEFRYTGLTTFEEAFEPGGSVSFQQMPNGVAVVDRWMLRLVRATVDSTVRGGTKMSWYASEGGGELARAHWEDGTSWRGSLGSIRVHATDVASKRPAAGVFARLAHTDYLAVADSNGDLVIEDLLPGPYSLILLDQRLGDLQLASPTSLDFVAVRDSVLRHEVFALDGHAFVADRCKGQKVGDDDGVVFLGQIVDQTGAPRRGIQLRAAPEMSPFHVEITTGSDGSFPVCLESTWLHSSLELLIQAPGGALVRRIIPLDDRVVSQRIILRTK